MSHNFGNLEPSRTAPPSGPVFGQRDRLTSPHSALIAASLAVASLTFAHQAAAVPPPTPSKHRAEAVTDGAISFPEDRFDEEALRERRAKLREALRKVAEPGHKVVPDPNSGSGPDAAATGAPNEQKPTPAAGNAPAARRNAPPPPQPKRIPGGAWFIAPHGGYEGIKAGTLLSYAVHDLTLGSEAFPLLIGYECGAGFLIDADGMAFEIDEFRCGESGCERLIEIPVIIDDGDLHSLSFDSWGYGHDARARQVADADGTFSKADELVSAMLEGRRLFAVVTLYGTNATPQVAEFPLDDFGLVHLSCP